MPFRFTISHSPGCCRSLASNNARPFPPLASLAPRRVPFHPPVFSGRRNLAVDRALSSQRSNRSLPTAEHTSHESRFMQSPGRGIVVASLTRVRSIRTHVSSSREELELLHIKTGWTPGRKSTRPTPEAIAQKNLLLKNALLRYSSLKDYVLHRIFRLQMSTRGNFTNSVMYCSEETLSAAQRTKKERQDESRDRSSVFVENMFPYDLPMGTKHFVLWFLLDQDESESSLHLENAEITHILNSRFVKAESEFVWYRNPKPSIVDGVTYHVQVFVKQ